MDAAEVWGWDGVQPPARTSSARRAARVRKNTVPPNAGYHLMRPRAARANSREAGMRASSMALLEAENRMPRSETPLRSDLFPEISPYASGMLAVDGRHTIYWEQSGNPEGVPVVFLHGGPGAGSAPVHRRFFDPQFYRIVVFDQRG